MKRKRWGIPKRALKAPAQEETGSDFSKLLKLFGSVPKLALFLNGLLAGAGYLFISGYLGKLGIEVAELEIGLPSLLLYGYIFSIDTLNYAGKAVLTCVTFMVTGLLIWLFNRALADAYPSLNKQVRGLISTPLGAVLALVILVGPGVTFNSGGDTAIRNELTDMALGQPKSALRTHIIETPEGKIKGTLVIADQRYTYLRAENIIYKISNDTQKVIRTIEFTSPGAGEAED